MKPYKSKNLAQSKKNITLALNDNNDREAANKDIF